MSKISTQRLNLVPITLEIAQLIQNGRLKNKNDLNLNLNDQWPDADFIEILPKIIAKLKLFDNVRGFTSYLIIKKEDSTVIGDAGFKEPPNELGEVDIGYGLIESERRKGFGVEAAKALVAWAFNHKDVKGITASCLRDNDSSMRLLKKIGAKEICRDKEFIYWKIEKRV